METIIIQNRETKKRRMTAKERNRKHRIELAAKAVYYFFAGAYYMIAGGAVGVAIAFGTLYAFPNISEEWLFMAFLIEGFIGLTMVRAIGYLLGRGIYKILCKITSRR